MPLKRWLLLATIVVFMAFCLWVVWSSQNDDSTVSVLTRNVKETMCWSAEPSTVCAIKAMAKYEKKGRYDEAVSTGLALADKHPDSFTSGWIYEDISALYLRKAKMDSGRAEEYLNQAALYRDKALRSLSDSPYSLQPLVAISESVGDLSATQRCAQYGNSLRLLDRMNLLADADKNRLARQFKPDLVERKKIESLSEWIDGGIKRVGGKLSASGCR